MLVLQVQQKADAAQSALTVAIADREQLEQLLEERDSQLFGLEGQLGVLEQEIEALRNGSS